MAAKKASPKKKATPSKKTIKFLVEMGISEQDLMFAGTAAEGVQDWVTDEDESIAKGILLQLIEEVKTKEKEGDKEFIAKVLLRGLARTASDCKKVKNPLIIGEVKIVK